MASGDVILDRSSPSLGFSLLNVNDRLTQRHSRLAINSLQKLQLHHSFFFVPLRQVMAAGAIVYFFLISFYTPRPHEPRRSTSNACLNIYSFLNIMPKDSYDSYPRRISRELEIHLLQSMLVTLRIESPNHGNSQNVTCSEDLKRVFTNLGKHDRAEKSKPAISSTPTKYSPRIIEKKLREAEQG